MATLVAEFLDVKEAISEEEALAPGLYEIRFYLTEPVAAQDIRDTKEYLISSGVDVRNVFQNKSDGLWYLGIKYRRKPNPENIAFALPVAVIPLVAFAFITALIGIGIFRLEDIVNNIGKLLLLGLGGTIVIVALLRKPMGEAAVAYTSRR